MDNNFILNSIGIGGAIFVGLLLFWFVSMYLRKRYTSGQQTQGYTPSTQISWKEKRRHPRMAVSWQATIGAATAGETVQLKDISLGGAFVVCANPLNLNHRLQITLHIPDRENLCLNAEVVWSNINVPEDRVVNRGMGIRFIDNEEKDRHKLNEALSATLEVDDNDNQALRNE